MTVFFTEDYSSNAYRAIIASCGITEFWYFDYGPNGEMESPYTGYYLGRKFGDWIREYNATHDDVYRHDDGDLAGQPVVPMF